MTQSYCVKCKTSTGTKNEKNATTKNGRFMIKGECTKCGTTKCRFVSKLARSKSKSK